MRRILDAGSKKALSMLSLPPLILRADIHELKNSLASTNSLYSFSLINFKAFSLAEPSKFKSIKALS